MSVCESECVCGKFVTECVCVSVLLKLSLMSWCW